jgi:hypothetical protein
MAESGGSAEFLTRKVGPLPMWMWLAGGGAAWFFFLRGKSSSSSSQQSAAQAQEQTGYGTDPSGNTGYIDPQTGYVYGSAEDIAALQQQGTLASDTYASQSASGGSQAGGSVDTSGDTGTTSSTPGGTTTSTSGTAGTTPSGTSVSTPGSGSTATSGTKTTTPAAPSSSSSNWQYPAPSGLTASSVSSTGYSISWNPVTGPGGQKPGTYTVATYTANGTKVDQFQSGSTSTKEYGAGGKGLTPSTSYRTDVWANGGPVAPPHATVAVTTKPKGS